MTETANLKLPYILSSQAQKHVTHNEALRLLDGVVQLCVLDRDLATPPASPADGDRYIVAGSPSGDWAGHAGDVAHRANGAWMFASPRPGWVAWVADEEKLLVFDGAGWTSPVAAGLDMLGINATADAVNRLAVASEATLFDHVGAGHQHKINKAAAGDTASLLFQTGYSGRAEMGLAGDDRFRLKVSANGSAWSTAVTIDPATANVGIGAALPDALLTLSANPLPTPGALPGGVIAHFVGATAAQSRFVFDSFAESSTVTHRRANGTPSMPAALAANDLIGGNIAYGYGATYYSGASRASLRFIAEEDWTDIAQGARCSLYVTAAGSTATSERLRVMGDGAVLPGADNAQTLGGPAARWSAVWAATGTIQTSDTRDKIVVGDLNFAASMVDAVNPVMFRWKIGGNEVRPSDTETAIDEDGNAVPAIEIASTPGARSHAGFIAQDIKAAMIAAGVDFGAWGLEDKDDPDSRQFMRPDQLIAVLWAALKETRARLDDVRDELNKLHPLAEQ